MTLLNSNTRHPADQQNRWTQEMRRSYIRPPRGKATPQQKRCLPTYAAATIPKNDEELSNIEYVGVFGRWGSSRDNTKPASGL
jgi:hypothetical protein